MIIEGCKKCKLRKKCPRLVLVTLDEDITSILTERARSYVNRETNTQYMSNQAIYNELYFRFDRATFTSSLHHLVEMGKVRRSGKPKYPVYSIIAPWGEIK